MGATIFRAAPAIPVTRKNFLSVAWRLWQRCQWCGVRLGRGEATVDHVRPLCRGGTDDIFNLVISCKPCNEAKGDQDWTDRYVSGPRWGLCPVCHVGDTEGVAVAEPAPPDPLPTPEPFAGGVVAEAPPAAGVWNVWVRAEGQPWRLAASAITPGDAELSARHHRKGKGARQVRVMHGSEGRPDDAEPWHGARVAGATPAGEAASGPSPGVTSAFVPPTTVEAAESRRAAMAADLAAMQARLGDLPRGHPRRVRLREDVLAAHGELRALKECLRVLRAERTAAEGSGAAALAEARKGVNNLCDYVRVLEGRVLQLEGENAALRVRIGEARGR